jgi:hypothetical protein
MSKSAHRNLAEHLRELPDEKLVALLRARPDLATPVPADISVLATRAHTRMSVARALDQLDRFTLEILDAFRLDPDRRTTWSQLRERVGGAAPEPTVRAAVDRLIELALIWPDGETLLLAGAVDEVTSPYAAGLGRPIAGLLSGMTTSQLSPVLDALHLPAVRQPEATALIAEAFADPVRLTGLVAAAPVEAKTVLDRLAIGPPLGAIRDARRVVPAEEADTPVRWLLAHGLLVAIDNDSVELPREVGLLLRGSGPLGPLHPAPPTVTPAMLSVSTVDSAGAGQVIEVVRLLEVLLEECAAEPPSVLRAGGLGVRDLRRLARVAGVDEPIAALLLEVARAAGLLDDTGEAEPEWLPTAAYDRWHADPIEDRWTRLARAWLGMARLPGLIGQRDEKDRLLAPLSFEVQRAGAPEVRRLALAALASQPRGAVLDPADVVGLLSWQAPRRGGRHRDDAIGWALGEAATLGILGRGALTGYGRALLAGDDPAGLLAAQLPAPLDHVLVQADLTVVAPGPLQADLAAEMALVADVESAGGATVFRVTPSSVRRALDAGRPAGDLHSLFAQRSRTPVPQALTYLIDDVARRHGGLRTGPASAYLRSDDEALLAEILADRRCETLRLRRLAPTVLITSTAVNRLLDTLRDAGYAPVIEDASGGLVLSRPEVRRAPLRARPIRPGADLPTLDDKRLAEAVRAVRRGDETARTARRAPVTTTEVPGTTTAATLAVLQHAARERQRVWLGYVDAHGGTLSRVVQPISIGAGYLRAEDERTDVLHTFALHRITSAALVEDE